MNVSINHPTDRPNFTIVNINGLTLYFSYQTIVAFDHSVTGTVVRENNWGPTTGKHLNYVDSGDAEAHRNRKSSEEFNRLLDIASSEYRIRELTLA